MRQLHYHIALICITLRRVKVSGADFIAQRLIGQCLRGERSFESKLCLGQRDFRIVTED
jgi:hypothetical protein